MNTREALHDMRKALAALVSNDEFSLALCFGFHTDPASGRREWFSVTLPVADRKRLIGEVKDEVLKREAALADELRKEADKLVGSK